MSVISINSAAAAAADATFRFADAVSPPASLVSTAPTTSSAPNASPLDNVNNATNADVNLAATATAAAADAAAAAAAAAAANATAAAAELGPDFVMRGVAFNDATPASLADLFAMSPFAATSAVSSPADSLDSERDYYVALRDARKQLAAKLRGALRNLREERAVKTGLLRKRYNMRNRNHAKGTGAKPTTTTHARAQHAQPQQRGAGALEKATTTITTTATDSFSASAPAPPAAAAGSKPRPPPKISATAVAARIEAGAKSVVAGKVSVPRESWYGDDVRMCSSPVSEEFEVELVDEEDGDDTHHDDVVATANVAMVAPQCRV